MSYTTESERIDILGADLERNGSLCSHNIFCRNHEQKMNVELLPCCKQRLSGQESWGTAQKFVDMLQQRLKDSENDASDGM